MKRLLARLGLGDWLDARTGYRDAAKVMLDEPLPPGTGWFFTLGSILLALLSVQLLTGAVLTLYYAPTPDHAYDSVRFITSLSAGRIEPETSMRKTRLLAGRLSFAISRPFSPMRTSRCAGVHGHAATSIVAEKGASPFGCG